MKNLDEHKKELNILLDGLLKVSGWKEQLNNLKENINSADKFNSLENLSAGILEQTDQMNGFVNNLASSLLPVNMQPRGSYAKQQLLAVKQNIDEDIAALKEEQPAGEMELKELEPDIVMFDSKANNKEPAAKVLQDTKPAKIKKEPTAPKKEKKDMVEALADKIKELSVKKDASPPKPQNKQKLLTFLKNNQSSNKKPGVPRRRARKKKPSEKAQSRVFNSI